MACCNCGHVQENVNDNTACNVCHSNDWSKAYISEN
jgi:RNA polymerase subunit RPABC4/transcription elongation factor Spt4